jgi:hypothetical protein
MNCLLNRDLEEATDFTSASWTGVEHETKPNKSTDTGLLAAVIVLAVIILLMLGGAGVAYLRYFRSVF